jgi:biopolymer transport protein ExbD
MKQIILLSILCIPFFAFAQQNTFKYKGELPTEKFLYFGQDSEDINYGNADKIAMRNRIYVMIDDVSEKLLLNGHEIIFKDFEQNFKYVLTNPNKLKHLPESIENAVIFTNIPASIDLSSNVEVLYFKGELISLKIISVYSTLLEKKLENILKTSWENLSEADVKALKKFQLNFAVPEMEESPFEEMIEESAAWEEVEMEESQRLPQEKRNVFTVLINSKNELFVQGEPMKVSELQAKAKRFVMNYNQDDDKAESPAKAVFNLKKGNGTSYEFYLTVYNELQAAYDLIWDQIAIERYGLEIKHLREDIQEEIKNDYPMNISEE